MSPHHHQFARNPIFDARAPFATALSLAQPPNCSAIADHVSPRRQLRIRGYLRVENPKVDGLSFSQSTCKRLFYQQFLQAPFFCVGKLPLFFPSARSNSARKTFVCGVAQGQFRLRRRQPANMIKREIRRLSENHPVLAVKLHREATLAAIVR